MGMVKGIYSKNWQQAGEEGTDMRDTEEDREDLVITYITLWDRQCPTDTQTLVAIRQYPYQYVYNYSYNQAFIQCVPCFIQVLSLMLTVALEADTLNITILQKK